MTEISLDELEKTINLFNPKEGTGLHKLWKAAKAHAALAKEIEFEIAALRKKAGYIRFRCDEKSTTLCDAVQITHDMLLTAARLEKYLAPRTKQLTKTAENVSSRDLSNAGEGCGHG